VLQHQQQVATAVERAKQVTMTELNAIIGVSTLCHFRAGYVRVVLRLVFFASRSISIAVYYIFARLTQKVEALTSVPRLEAVGCRLPLFQMPLSLKQGLL
jgi:hypothetical protein